MPTTQTADFGVVRFMPNATFQDPTRGLDKEARIDKLVEEILAEQPKPQSVNGWPRVRIEPIHRGGMFVIDGITDPAFTAMLRFCPEKPDAGDYEIRYRPHGRVEKGRTVRLKEVPAGETNQRVSMLGRFQVRYFIVTAADDRARTELVWLVGLKSYRPVEDTEIEPNVAV